ncbi:MAG: endo-1,4-beta-xylanase [Candidatus Eremiobacteraeota bacterium]|nr:endo-1,4-beta-xylanase [Candidatus Eremiobacteraeota bacterium]MBV9699805.1 endo-1,4-beta-xylanase [Candidatus Eremiobacteraeota bacterium]
MQHQPSKKSIGRRRAIATMVAGGAVPFLAAAYDASAESHATLAQAAAHNRRVYGSAVRIRDVEAEPDYRQAIVHECSLLVPEFEMNWNEIEPAYGQLSFDRIDALVDFATDQGKKLRGHVLFWHLSVPDWATKMLRARPDWGLVTHYVGFVMDRYRELIHQWTVVNEAIDPGQRSDGLRNSIYLQAFGPSYINRAFSLARSLAPNDMLLISEYGLEYDNPEQRARRYYFLKLIERLKAAGVPLDCIGLQGHLDLRLGQISAPAIAAFLRELNDMKLPVIVTELDVKESNYAASAQERDRMVADETRRYLDAVLSHSRCLGVTTWGLSDRHSWIIQVTPQDYARFPGAWKNGESPGVNRGLPLDWEMKPKPMYFALRDALWRNRVRR